MNGVFIHGLASCLGAKRSISELPYLGEEKLRVLRELGLKNYCKFQEGMDRAIEESIRKTLEASEVPRASIDWVVLVSSSFWKEPFMKTGFSKLLARLGLAHANVALSSLSECANTAPALLTALSLMQCRRADCMLIILADEHFEERSRIVEPNISVTSDGALSFVLRREQSPLRVVDAYLRTNSRLIELDSENDKLEIMRESIRGLKISLEHILEKNSLTKGDVARYFMCNYNLPTQKLHNSVFGLRAGCLFSESLADIGHHFSADVFLNLQRFLETAGASEAASKENLILLSSGPLSWGSILIERTH